MTKARSAAEIQKSWDSDARWAGIVRRYGAPEVVRLRGSLHIEHSLARRGAERLWRAMGDPAPVRALGAMTGNQAVEQVAAGAAGVHFEDQLASAKKCGHMGGKVLVPTREFIQKLQAARLAADLLDVPTVLIARTDANSARLLTSDADPRDHAFMLRERAPE